MAVRATMLDLNSRVSGLVGDASNAVVSAQLVQDTLDRWRTVVVQQPLTPEITRTQSSGLQYLTFDSPYGDWEGVQSVPDVVCYNNAFAVITPSTYDWLTGRFTFSTSQFPPVYLSGTTYDVYAAAASLCEYRAAQLAIAFDFQTDGQRFFLNQQQAAFRELAATYWGRARARSGRLTRDDLNPNQTAGSSAYVRFHRSTTG